MLLVKDLISCFLFVLLSILIIKNLINKNSSKSIFHKIVLIFLYTFIIFLTNSIISIPLKVLIIVLIFSLFIKILYSLKISSSIASSIITLILFMVPQLLTRTEINIININDDIENLILFILSYLISLIPIVRSLLNRFITKLEENKSEVTSLAFLISSFTFFYYIIFLNRNISVNKIIIMLLIVVLCILYIVHIYDKNKYQNLIKKYNSLLDFAHSYEEELEKDCLIRHEHKNQLAVIKGMSKETKVIDYINEIIKSYKDEEKFFVKGLNILPNGGLRGLIYYKICIMKKKEIKYNLDISKNVKPYLLKLSSEQKKNLSYIIGVLLDNAIEECEGALDSNISIEMYYLNKDINIVISNTLKNKISLNRIGEKGYSKKGTNRGNGLFLIKKLLKHSKETSIMTKIINNYFVQEIKINTNM